MLGAEGVESTLTSIGGRIGPDEFDQQRSALIRENNTLFQNILDAAYQGVPSFVTSIAGGGLGGLAVKAGARALGMTASRGAMTTGTFAGSAATIFPMELESSYQAALQGGYDVNDGTDQPRDAGRGVRQDHRTDYRPGAYLPWVLCQAPWGAR
jgi:hypothetical protein